jgi:hypothetical protein
VGAWLDGAARSIASPSDGMVRMGGWLDEVYWMEAWHDGACNAAAVIIVPMGAWLMEPQDPSRRRMVQMRAWRGLHRPSHPDGMVWMGAWHDGARRASNPSSCQNIRRKLNHTTKM